MKPVDYHTLAAKAYSEDEFQAEVIKRAKVYDWWWYHTHDSRRSNAGFLDLFLVRPPRIVFAELKTWGGRVRPAQRVLLELLYQVPHVETFVWRPADLLSGEIDKVLK